MRRLALVLACVGVWLALPATAEAARVAVGISPRANADDVARAIERRTGSGRRA